MIRDFHADVTANWAQTKQTRTAVRSESTRMAKNPGLIHTTGEQGQYDQLNSSAAKAKGAPGGPMLLFMTKNDAP